MTTLAEERIRECRQLLHELENVDAQFASNDLVAARELWSEALFTLETWADLREHAELQARAEQWSQEAADASNTDIASSLAEAQQAILAIERSAEELRKPSLEMQASAFKPLRFEDPGLVAEFIVEASEHQAAIDGQLLELENQPGNKDIFDAVYRSLHTIKGMAGFLELIQCQDLARAAESVLDRARKQEVVFGVHVLDALLDTSALFRSHFETVQRAVEHGEAITFDARFPAAVERLTAVCENAEPPETPEPGPDLPEPTPEAQPAPVHDHVSEPAKNVTPTKAQEAQRAKPSATSSPRVKVDPTVRVSAPRLDALADTIGELTVLESMLQESAGASDTRRLRNQLAEMHRVMARLHDLASELRAVPIRGVFNKMSRLARDVGRKTGKRLNVELIGAETEIDKSIVDGLSDPLVHLIRNAVDHGLETPEEREQQGKTPMGTLQITARHDAGDLLVEIADDGRGLNRNAILKKAIEKGLVAEGDVISDAKLYRLILHSGFSTRTEVSDISGRGVGMDVVAQAIERLSGRIEISSEPQKGTTFQLRFPLTLAVLDGLLVRVSGERYVLPIRDVVRSLRPQAFEVKSIMGRGEVLDSGGKIYPIVRLHELFRLQDATTRLEQSFLVLVEAHGQAAAIMVDDLVGQQRVVVRSLGEGLKRTPTVGGGAVMPDGRVGLILDTTELTQCTSRSAHVSVEDASHTAAPMAVR